MTLFEHALYGGAVVYKSSPNLFWWSAFFGTLPDLPPFFLAVYKVGWRKALRHFTWDAIPEDVPDSVYQLYYVTHSFVTAATLFVVLSLVSKPLSLLALAYGLHVLCDIPLHNSRFSTRFLYPLSSIHLNVYSARKHRWVHLVSALLLVVLYLFLLKKI